MVKGRICSLSIFKKYHLLGVGVVGRPAVCAELVGGHRCVCGVWPGGGGGGGGDDVTC